MTIVVLRPRPALQCTYVVRPDNAFSSLKKEMEKVKIITNGVLPKLYMKRKGIHHKNDRKEYNIKE